MRVAAIVAVLLTLPAILAGGSSAEIAVEFSTPASITGLASATNVHWLFVRPLEGDRATIALDGELAGHEHRMNWFHMDVSEAGAIIPINKSSAPIAASGAGSIALAFHEPGGIWLEFKEPIAAHLDNGHLLSLPMGRCPAAEVVSHKSSSPTLMYAPCLREDAAGIRASASAVLGAATWNDVKRIAWHGATATCVGLDGCPGSTVSRESRHGPDGNSAATVQRRWVTLGASDGTVALESPRPMSEWVFGSSSLDLSVEGQLRLPQARFEGCTSLPCPDGSSTATLAGPAQITNLEGSSGATMTAQWIRGSNGWFLDEQPVAWTAGALAASALLAGLLATAAKVGLLGMFTRLKPAEALEHPRRKVLHQFIKEHPGATFREIVRRTGIPTGTARHHLSVLRRSDLIVEKAHQSTLRFFENHGKFDETWDTVVMLREKPLRTLHEWLKERPRTKQKDIVAAMSRREQWSRGTTQHRLSRLVKAGLVTFRAQGRLKLYTAHEAPQRTSKDDEWKGLDANWPEPSYA